MKRMFTALLTVALVLALAAPAFAAGRMHGQSQGPGVAAPAGDQLQLHEQDRAQDGTGENCTTDGTPLAPLDGTGAQVQGREAGAAAEMRAQAQTHMGSRDTTGAPEWAGTNVPTAQAQAVMMRNAERVQLRVDMPAEIKAKLAGLFQGIAARLQAHAG